MCFISVHPSVFHCCCPNVAVQLLSIARVCTPLYVVDRFALSSVCAAAAADDDDDMICWWWLLSTKLMCACSLTSFCFVVVRHQISVHFVEY